MGYSGGTWGAEALSLDLPAAIVKIGGLSRSQSQRIRSLYGSFEVPSAGGDAREDVVISALKLPEPLAFPPERFRGREGYAPEKVRRSSEISVTGFEFVGYLRRDASRPVTGALAVAREEELTLQCVLENFLRTVIAFRAVDQNGVLLHSSAVMHAQRAYLFVGHSNAGKTTLARKAVESGAGVLSDDINLVLPEIGGYRARKVPFTGEFGRRAENRSGNGSFVLGGLVLLEKAPSLFARPVSPGSAVAGLLANCPFVNDDPEEFPRLTEVLVGLVAEVPVIRLGVAREDSFTAIMEAVRECLPHD